MLFRMFGSLSPMFGSVPNILFGMFDHVRPVFGHVRFGLGSMFGMFAPPIKGGQTEQTPRTRSDTRSCVLDRPAGRGFADEAFARQNRADVGEIGAAPVTDAGFLGQLVPFLQHQTAFASIL